MAASPSLSYASISGVEGGVLRVRTLLALNSLPLLAPASRACLSVILDGSLDPSHPSPSCLDPSPSTRACRADASCNLVDLAPLPCGSSACGSSASGSHTIFCLVSCAHHARSPQGENGALSSTRAHVAEHRLVRLAPRAVERPSRPSQNTGAPEE